MCCGVGFACFPETDMSFAFKFKGECTSPGFPVCFSCMCDGKSDCIENDVVWEFCVHVLYVCTVRQEPGVFFVCVFLWNCLRVEVMSLHAHSVKDFILLFLRMKDRPREA